MPGMTRLLVLSILLIRLLSSDPEGRSSIRIRTNPYTGWPGFLILRKPANLFADSIPRRRNKIGPGRKNMAKLTQFPTQTNTETAGVQVAGGRAQILVVDDDRAFCETIAKCLAQRGYDVVCADGGEAAAEAIEERKPDLIVTDVMMPGMDGIDLINWLHDQSIDVPVIAISGEGIAGRDGEG